MGVYIDGGTVYGVLSGVDCAGVMGGRMEGGVEGKD